VFGLNDEIPIHLQPGENELLVAVTEYNGGWAFECELHPAGVKAKNVMNWLVEMAAMLSKRMLAVFGKYAYDSMPT
jgi:hypothetical protein